MGHIISVVHLMNGWDPIGTGQFLNQISVLIFGWEITDFVTMINQKSTSQCKINQLSTKFQPFFNIDISTSNLVDFWLNCDWEVDFWLIIVTKSMIFKPNINVEDGWGKSRLNVEKLICAHWGSKIYFGQNMVKTTRHVNATRSYLHFRQSWVFYW